MMIASEAGLLPTRERPPTAAADNAPLVRALWRQTLGPKAADPQAHILQVGVGLKRIVRLQKALQDGCGVTVPATALMRLGTVDALLAAMHAATWPAPSPCVLLKDGDDRPPLYVLSAGSGLVLELCELVRAIDYAGPICGLQLPGLDGEREPLDTLAAVGEHYGTALAAQQPDGPFHLVGYSFGGAAAVETARYLAARGRTIGLLGLLDSSLDEHAWPKAAWLAGVLKRCVKRAADARALPPRQAVRHVATRAANLARYGVRMARGQTAASVHASSYWVGGLEPDFQRVRDCAVRAFQRYTPKPLPLPVTLFQSELGDPHACDQAAIWRQFIRRLEVVRVPGSHTTMVRPPHAQVLAAAIASRLPPGEPPVRQPGR